MRTQLCAKLLVATAILSSAAAAGCGGGSSGTSFSYAATKRCLASKGYLPKPFNSSLFRGTAGNLAVYFSGAGFPPGRVVVMFGKNHGEADDILAKAKLIGKATGTSHVIIREVGNVVYGGGYSGKEVAVVGHCLRPSA